MKNQERWNQIRRVHVHLIIYHGQRVFGSQMESNGMTKKYYFLMLVVFTTEFFIYLDFYIGTMSIYPRMATTLNMGTKELKRK